MATLNPDAPIFVSSAHNPVPSSPLELWSIQNPNPQPNYFLHPIYIPVPTPYGIKVIYGYSPVHYIPNEYLNFLPCDLNFHLALPPSAPVPSCVSIKELDENLDADHKSDTPEERIKSERICNALVLKRRRYHAPKQNREVVCAPSCHRQIVRPPRFQQQCRKNFVKVPHCNYEISADDAEFFSEGKATLMIKNIPSKFSTGNMVAILKNHCIHVNEKAMASDSVGDEAVLSEFDYVYVPIDFKTNSNFGFAFVNFTNLIGARRLYHHLHNYRWTDYGSSKVCAVNYAVFQGLAESIAQADGRLFPWYIDDVHLPVHFEPACNGLNFNECVVIRHGRRQ